MRSPAAQLVAAASAVHARAGKPRGLPAALFFTDPARIADPAAIIAKLPRGCGIVIRHFGQPNAIAQAAELAKIARRRGLIVLIGADRNLARRLRADGVHLPERLAHLAKRLPDKWLVTAAWHPDQRRPPPRYADAAVVSALFASQSPSAARALGARGAERAAKLAGRPCYGLGGLTPRTTRALSNRAWVGLAAVDGFRT
jgi:thiamine-phosphate pyrophosphorylase